MLPELTIHAVQIQISEEILAAIESELKTGVPLTGDFFIGEIATNPESLYFLWHAPEHAPFSTMLNPEDLATPAAARGAAFQFMLKWNQRDL